MTSNKNNQNPTQMNPIDGQSAAQGTPKAVPARMPNDPSARYMPKQPRPAEAGRAGASEQPKTSKRTVLIVIGVVLAAIAIWLLVWLFACNGSSFFDPNARTGQAPYKTDEQMQAELDRVIEEGMFNISIASVIEFENANSEGTAYIENVPNNRYNMQVVITDDSNGETLYESGVLAPNQYIEKIALAKPLEAGSYGCTALFTAMDPTTSEQMGQAAAKITINVLE